MTRYLPVMAALLLCASVLSQDGAKDAGTDLDRLLAQLKATDGDAWRQRAAAIDTAVAGAKHEAEQLQKDAAKLAEAAAAERAAAAALTSEAERLGELRKILGALRFRDPAAKADPAPPASRLDAVLQQLCTLPDEAWKARADAMAARRTAHEKQAVEHDAASKKRTADAGQALARAKALEQEKGRLAQLEKLLGGLNVELLAAAKPAGGKAEKGDRATPAPEKEQPKAPQPKDGKPKEVPSKDSKPKDAPPKKPAPDQDAPKPAAKMAAEAAPAAADATPAADEELVNYDDHMFAIFDANCILCHDVGDAEAGLDLSSYATAMQGGSSGRTIVPGDAEASRLYLLVTHREKPTMPPDEPRLDKQLLERVRTWIAQGAPKDMAQARKLAAQRAEARAEAARKAAAAGDDEALSEVMPTELPRVPKQVPARPGAMRAVAASPTSPLLAVPGHEQILLLDAATMGELGVVPFPFGQVSTLQFTRDGSALLAAGGVPGQRGGAVLIDVRTGAVRGTFGEQRDVALAAAVSPAGDLIAVGGTRRRFEVFRTADGQRVWQEDHDDWVTELVFSPDGALLASADRAGDVQVREAVNGREVQSFRAADGCVTDMVFSPDSKELASAGADRSVALHRIRDGRRRFRQQRHGDQTLCLTWLGKDRLVSGGADGRLLVWKVDGSNDKPLPSIGEWAYGVAASRDAATVYVSDWAGRLHAIDYRSRKRAETTVPLTTSR